MQFSIHLSITNPENGSITTEEICLLDKASNSLEDLGLSLTESKTILSTLQDKIVHSQTNQYVNAQKICESCCKKHRIKGSYPIVFRTLFGDLKISSPRFYSCKCKKQEYKTFSPLAKLITEHTSAERLYLETKWASIIPFEKTVSLLKDVLPMSKTLNATSVRNHLYSK